MRNDDKNKNIIAIFVENTNCIYFAIVCKILSAYMYDSTVLQRPWQFT